jgi:hypothetical protein
MVSIAILHSIHRLRTKWWGQATAAETEAAAGVHKNQPTDRSDSDRNSIRGGGSGDGGSRGSVSGNIGNGAATAAREIYIKRGGCGGHGGNGGGSSGSNGCGCCCCCGGMMRGRGGQGGVIALMV